jgi:phage gp29-like protein
MAVAYIAGDCAAIVPESMLIEFGETSNVGASTNLYKERCDWLDMQTSKLVLGQTATTDAVTGGLGSGKEHRQVQEDIERADARAISAILNRDLIRPWINLEYGTQKVYPRLIMVRPEEEDLAAFSLAVTPLIDAGLRVKQSEVLAKFGLSEPGDGDKILGNSAAEPPKDADDAEGETPRSKIKGFLAPIKRVEENSGGKAALNASEALTGRSGDPVPEAILADQLEIEAGPAVAGMIGRVEAMLAASRSLEEFGEMLRAGFGDLNAEDLAGVMAEAIIAAELGGIAAVEDDAGG